MRPIQIWADKAQDKERDSLCIYDMVFQPDGDQLLVAAGTRILVYNVNEGNVVQALKGHKDTIYSLSYGRDGIFASGGADKLVIIWSAQMEGILKYSHNDSVQCIAFSPVSGQLLSCASSDIGLWSSELKSVTKHKVSAKVCSCSWTNDGQFFAIGMYSGVVTIWTKNAEEKVRIERPGGHPIWSLSWNPSREDAYDVLTVTDWGQKLSYFQLNGKQIGKDRNLDFDPCCVSYFSSGEFAVIAGSNKKALLYSREGAMLGTIAEGKSWVWCCCQRPGQNFVAIGFEDGTIGYYQLSFNTVHGLYKDRYAFREHMTDVMVQHLFTDEKVKIKCRDHIKKIAVYKNRLAVQLTDRIIVYEVTSDEPTDMQYKVKEKISKHVECSLLVVCSENIVLCLEKRLQSLSFSGEKIREWVMESQIRYIKVVGGPPGREGLLVGLKNGQVMKVFVDNPFPVVLLKHQNSVRCLDLSASRTKLAIVDERNTLLVYDAVSKELLYQEPKANSVAWNTSCEDMLCYSGEGMLSIKANNFSTHQQRQQGFVVGFTGSKIFCLDFFAMTCVDVPQSAPMIQYLERKLYKDAYKIGCLGVTEGDWNTLALEALEGMDFDISKKAFHRLRDLRFLELIHSIEERKRRGETNNQLFLPDVLAYQGKFSEAAKLYKQGGQPEKAMEMYTDLRQFDKAKEFVVTTDKNVKQLVTKQADWFKTTNDPQAACDMYVAAGEYLKAVDIMGENGWVDRIIGLVHDLDKASQSNELLYKCATYLKNHSQYSYAAEVYEKLKDIKSLVSMYVSIQQWNEAFSLAMQHPEFKDDVYTPYATWLVENDKFDEAQEALNKAGRQNEAIHLLEQLAENAIKESRFDDAGFYYWMLTKSALESARKEAQGEANQQTMGIHKENFYKFKELSEVYYVYHHIRRYTDQPFTSLLPEALMNMSRFLAHKIITKVPPGVSQVAVYLTLAKQSKTVGAFKLARYAYEKLKTLRIPGHLQEAIDMGCVTVRSKPFMDKEDLLPMCYRCSTTNQLFNTAGAICSNCRQPFVFSFVSFEVLPVVEFFLAEGISDDEAMKLIQMEAPRRSKNQGWKEVEQGNTQVLKLDEEGDGKDGDPFTRLLNTLHSTNGEFFRVVVDRETLQAMHRTEVIVKKWGAPIGNQYYQSLIPDISIAICRNCNQLFHSDDYEMQILAKDCCPFCRRAVDST
eukprot:Em0001g623a